MLLAHTSGLADYQENTDFLTALNADPGAVWTPQQLIDFTVALPPAGAPGERHTYSNANYILAGLVAQSATGISYGQALRGRVLEPAALEHVWLEGERDADDPTATGYSVVGNGAPQDTTGQYRNCSPARV